MLTAPLIVPGMAPIGVVQLVNKRGGEFQEEDLQIIETVSAVSAMAYVNATLREQSNRAASMIGMGQVAHDIMNLAVGVRGNVTLLESELGGDGARPELTRTVQDLEESVESILGYSTLITKLSKGAPLTPQPKSGEFGKAVHLAASFQEGAARMNGVGVLYDICPETAVSDFDRHYVARIVQNLVGNAVKAVAAKIGATADLPCLFEDDRGRVYGTVTVRYARCDGWHEIDVSDTGIGMTESAKRKILNATAETTWGTGWGTKTVLELTKALGGSVDIESAVGEGSSFRVRIPVVSMNGART
jgi:signal transduction histidine kinase